MDWANIEIPFTSTDPQDVYSGKKTATRRTKRYGAKIGMKMRAVFRSYSIVDLSIMAVYQQKLGNMTEVDCDNLAARRVYEKLGFQTIHMIAYLLLGSPPHL